MHLHLVCINIGVPAIDRDIQTVVNYVDRTGFRRLMTLFDVV